MADRLALPLARREGEPDPGVTAAGVPLVDRQDMTKHRGVEGDAGLFEGFADGCGQDALAFIDVPRR